VNASAGAALGFIALLLAALAAAIVAILRRGRLRPRPARTSSASPKMKRRALLKMMPGFLVIGSVVVVWFIGHPTIALVISVGYGFLGATLAVITGISAGRRSRSKTRRPFE
jgi:ABC-type Fe3+ transport system permease subunit